MTKLIPAVNDNDIIYGDPKATIELVEYGDYQCPHCGRAYPIVKNIQQKLGPDLRFVFRNFPLSKIHPYAKRAAIAAGAAGLQDKFWEMHDIIFENQETLDPDNILAFAQAIGLDLDRFRQDIQQKELAEKVEKDFESGVRSGVNKTPTFFVNGIKYDGDWEENEFFKYLRDQLNQVSIH